MQQSGFIDKTKTQHVPGTIVPIFKSAKLYNTVYGFLHWTHGCMDKTMTLLKPLNNTSILTPYENFFIHSLDKERKLISEQNTGEPNPILQLDIDPSQPPA